MPIGLFATVVGYLKLEELSERRPAKIDWPGNITFALGLILLMIGITYGIEPYRHNTMGWTNPFVLICLALGVVLLVAFGIIETKVAQPMFRLQLFKIRAFSAGVFASFLTALSQGGLMFMLIIWLQGIWLPLHGYDFARTPLWAGLAMLPLTAGFLLSGPISGVLSDHYGARPFTSGGPIATAVCFALLEFMPIDFSYPIFAVLLFALGLSMSMFGSPNRAAVMNSLPPEHRGSGSGMNTTFINSAQVLSIGIFFTLLIVGLSPLLPAQPLPRPGRPRRLEERGHAGLTPAPGLHSLRRLLGLQPGAAPCRLERLVPPQYRPAGDPDGSEFLPIADCQAVPIGPPCRSQLRHRGQLVGGSRIVDAGRATSPISLLHGRRLSGPRSSTTMITATEQTRWHSRRTEPTR